MNQLIENRFFVDMEIDIPYRSNVPVIDGDLSDWQESERIPAVGLLDGQRAFADVYCAWHETGLYFAVSIKNKTMPLSCDPARYWSADNVRICVDTRDARHNRRASRYCHMFYCLPKGGGKGGDQPVAASAPIRQAKEPSVVAEPGRLPVAAIVDRQGYRMEVHIPTRFLAGFDPDQHPRIGLYYIVEDEEFGQQYLTVGDELQWYTDPSTWAVACLKKP